MLRRRFNLPLGSGRELVEDLIAARNAGSSDAVANLLCADARYWDCLRGEVEGRDPVTPVLCSSPVGDAELVVDALAVEHGHAVVEMRASGNGRSGRFELRTTEAYSLRDDGIAWCRAYFDPAELPAQG